MPRSLCARPWSVAADDGWKTCLEPHFLLPLLVLDLVLNRPEPTERLSAGGKTPVSEWGEWLRSNGECMRGVVCNDMQALRARTDTATTRTGSSLQGWLMALALCPTFSACRPLGAMAAPGP
jgi:hypothetical protein